MKPKNYSTPPIEPQEVPEDEESSSRSETEDERDVGYRVVPEMTKKGRPFRETIA
jgi:hypothetical protein